MPKPAGTVEINGFVPPELKAAFIAKCKQEGRTQNWVITHLIADWVASPPPMSADISAPAQAAKPKRKRAG